MNKSVACIYICMYVFNIYIYIHVFVSSQFQVLFLSLSLDQLTGDSLRRNLLPTEIGLILNKVQFEKSSVEMLKICKIFFVSYPYFIFEIPNICSKL